MFRRLLLLGLLALFSLVFGVFTFTPVHAVILVRFYGYWVILAAFILFGWYCIRSLRDVRFSFSMLREWWPAMAFILAATAFLHLHEKHEFKIVADEVLLSSTAMEMHFERQAAVVLRGYEYAGNFIPMQVFVDKRPLFFPLLISLMHDFTGYRVGNVFVLNALISLVLNTVLFLLGRRLGGPWAGVAAVLLLCGIPLVAQNATGGGFELLNITMMMVTFWLGLRYADRPEDGDRLSAFALSSVLLAETRYESVLFVIPVAASILYLWWRERRINLPWALYVVPPLLILYLLQHKVFDLSETSWQMSDVAGATTPFALHYFYDNVGHALNFFLSFDGTQPSSWLLLVLGLPAVGFFALVLYKEHHAIFSRQPATGVFCIFILTLVVHTGIMLCYFWGHWDDPIIRRLSLPTQILLILATIMVLPKLVGHRLRWRVLTGVAGLYILSFTMPASAMHRFTQENFAARTTNWVAGYIRGLGDKTALAIDNNSGLQWFLYRKSCVNPALLAARTEEFLFHFKLHSFDEVLVVQRAGLNLKTGERYVSSSDDLGPGVKLQLIEEKPMSPIYLMRISRVVSVDEPVFKAWAAARREQDKKAFEAKSSASAKSAPAVPTMDLADPDNLVLWLRNLP
ncbi:MAG TPA: glycosyltransferase family 39 protein [Rariglobus sp.]|jgi:hypothetical protein|nr:glycosyltransferase family 39 protein [Rariglobus sp.]